MAVGHVLRHILAGDDVVGGAFVFSTELHEHVVMVLGGEVLSLVGQDPALVLIPGALALDRDGPFGLRVGGQDIDAAGVAHRDRGDEAAPGELSRDEVFAGDAGKLGAGFHNVEFMVNRQELRRFYQMKSSELSRLSCSGVCVPFF